MRFVEIIGNSLSTFFCEYQRILLIFKITHTHTHTHIYIYTYTCRHSILHPWFNQGEWLEWQSMYPKKSWLHYMHQFVLILHASICLCITCINSFIAYTKNDLEILTVKMVCLVSKSDHQIERYRMIKLHDQYALCLNRVNHTWSI